MTTRVSVHVVRLAVCPADYRALAHPRNQYLVKTRRVPVQRAVERDEIPYPYKVDHNALHSRA